MSALPRLAFGALSIVAHAAIYVSVGSASGQRGAAVVPKQETMLVAYLTSPADLRTIAESVVPQATRVAESLPAAHAEEIPVPQKEDQDAQASSGLGDEEKETASSLLPILPPTEPRYFASGELTQVPHVKNDLPPEKMIMLPEAAPRTVVMHLFINEQGTIDKVDFKDASALPENVRQT